MLQFFILKKRMDIVHVVDLFTLRLVHLFGKLTLKTWHLYYKLMIPTEYMYNIIKVPFVYYTHTKKQQETFSNEIKHIFSKRGV